MPDRTCTVDGCAKPQRARGWCATHWKRWRVHGDTADPTPRIKPPCAVDGCGRPARTRGWCVMHYSRWYKRSKRGQPGTVEDPKPKPVLRCSVEGCDRDAYGRGLCSMHHLRWHRHGSTDDPRTKDPSYRSIGAPCSVDGCERPVAARSMCCTHNYRLEKFGSLEVPGVNPPHGTKWCHKCKQYKPRSEYYANATEGGRLESPCKSCRSRASKLYLKKRSRSQVQAASSARNRQRRAREKQAKSEPYTAKEIADRDGWICQICHKRIGRSFKFPHRRSLSIDHIIPISQGGDDIRVNVQAAHFSCNASKNNRGVDQLRLIG